MKVGRNEPCLCGSGLKYKKCCLNKEVRSQTEDLGYARLRKIEESFIPKLINHAREVFEYDIIDYVWAEFHNSENDEEFDPDNYMNMVFFPWFFGNWVETEPDDDDCPLNTTVIESYLSKYETRLTPDEKTLLKTLNRAPFSMYEIVDINRGHGYRLKDLLRNLEFDVIEKSASKNAELGTILYCSIINIDGKYLGKALAPYPMPPIYKQDILSLKKKIIKDIGKEKISGDDLCLVDSDIRLFYLDVVKAMHSMPDFKNMDGDSLVPQKLIFEINDANEAFHALKHLASIELSEKELLEKATSFIDGKVRTIGFPWLGYAKNSIKTDDSSIVLGHIKIDGKKLVAKVNSSERAKRIETEILSCLGDKAKYKTTLIEPIESQLNASNEKAISGNKSGGMSLKDMPKEILDQIEKLNKDYWKNWFITPIPALNNMTPEDAALTEEGRDLLNSLLLHYRQENDEKTDNLIKYDLKAIKKRLNL